MVTIVGFREVESKSGKNLVFMEVQGEVKVVQSQETGKFYLTSNKASMACVFPVEVCKTMIGQRLSGNVIKVECEPYPYVNKETGETITLTYRYEYSPEENVVESPMFAPMPALNERSVYDNVVLSKIIKNAA